MSARALEAALAPLLAAGLVVRASGAAATRGVIAAPAALVVPLGIAAIDEALPGGGLARAAVHELVAARGDTAARALAAIVAGRAGGPVLWIQLARDAQEEGQIYPYGLATLGLDPDRVFAVTAATAQDALWAMEEALRAGCAGAVIGDGLAPDLTASRRLLLAAESGSGPALVVRPMPRARAREAIVPQEAAFGRPGRDKSERAEKYSTAAATVWRVASAASADDVGTGAPRWELMLARCRGGRVPHSWLVEWDGTQLAAPRAKPRVAVSIANVARAG
jgi:protein ImuA